MHDENLLGPIAMKNNVEHWPMHFNFHFVNWLPAALTAIVIALLLILEIELPWQAGAVEAVVPLVAALQAAFLFSPEDEAALEIILACPRPIVRTLLERLMTLLVMLGGVALVGSLLSSILAGSNDVFLSIVRWLSPLVFLMSVSLFATLVSRQPALGVTLSIVMWFAFIVAGDALLDLFPFLWPVHAYLQPDTLKLTYALNRVTLLVIGTTLIAFALRQLRDEERLLLGVRVKRSQPEPSLES